MANDVVEGLKNTVRYLPQTMIQGILGPNMGHKVEGWLGMPLGPESSTSAMPGAGDVYQAPGAPDPNYQREMLERANRSFQTPQQPPRRMMPQR
jgi:hypothetical protein